MLCILTEVLINEYCTTNMIQPRSACGLCPEDDPQHVAVDWPIHVLARVSSADDYVVMYEECHPIYFTASAMGGDRSKLWRLRNFR